MITKPIGLATKAVVTVSGEWVAVDIVGKPVGKAVRVVKPITPE